MKHRFFKRLEETFSLDRHFSVKSKHIFNSLCTLFIIFALIYTLLLLFSLYRLDYTLAPHGIIFRTVSLLFPPLLWIAGTGTSHLTFHRHKLYFFILVSVFEILLLTGVLFQLLSVLFLPHFWQYIQMKFSPNEWYFFWQGLQHSSPWEVLYSLH